MKPAVHQYEDKLLELAYGELPQHEANAVESHVRTCTRCTEALGQIRAVRSTMGQLPVVAPPEAGLESLFAYADQAARRNAAGPAPTATWWRKLMAPMMAAGALCIIGVVAWQTSREGAVVPTREEIAVEARQKKDAMRTESLRAAPVVAEAPPPAPAAEAPQTAQAEGWAAAEQEQNERQKQAVEVEAKKESKLEVATRAPAKIAPKPAPSPQRKMAGAANGDELGDLLAKAKTSDSKNKKAAEEVATLDNFGDGRARGGKMGYDDDAKDRAAADKAPAAPAEKKEASKDFGVVAQAPGNSGGSMPRSQVQAEPRPSAPPPPPLEQQASSDSRTSLGGLGLGIGSSGSTPSGGGGSYASNAYGQSGSGSQAPQQQQREVMNQKGSLGERDDAAGSRRADAPPAAAAKPAELRASFDAQLKAARAAKANRDTEEEVRILKTVLDGHAQGSARLEALNGVCRGLQALGMVDEASAYCGMLVREFPDSRVARDWLDAQSRTIQRPAAKRSKSQQYELDEERAAPAPADAKPAQAY